MTPPRMTNEQAQFLTPGTVLTVHPRETGQIQRYYDAGGEFIFVSLHLPVDYGSRPNDQIISVRATIDWEGILKGESPIYYCSRFLPHHSYDPIDKIMEIWG